MGGFTQDGWSGRITYDGIKQGAGGGSAVTELTEFRYGNWLLEICARAFHIMNNVLIIYV